MKSRRLLFPWPSKPKRLSLGRLSALTDASGNTVVSYFYDAAGRLNKKVNGNGTYTTYDYDADGKTLNLTEKRPSADLNASG